MENLRRELHPDLPHLAAHLTILPPRPLQGTESSAPQVLEQVGCGDSGQSGPTVAAPTVDLSMSLKPVAAGQASTLTWSSQNAMSCGASGAWSGTQPTSGAQTITQSAVGSYTYSLTCTGAGGSGAAFPCFVVSASTLTTDASKLGELAPCGYWRGPVDEHAHASLQPLSLGLAESGHVGHAEMQVFPCEPL